MKKQAFIVIFIFLLYSVGEGKVDHQISIPQWNYQNAEALILEQRIKEAAQEDQKYSISRIAFYHIALPADITEYNDLDKNSVLVITAIAQNPDELPLKSVYILYHNKKIILEPILSKNILIQDEFVKKVFGSYRQDSFYFFPIYLQLAESQLTVDWAIKREGFAVAKFSDDKRIPIDFAYDDKDIAIQTGKVNDDVLKQILKREYSIIEQN